jgi:hypothetical protein
MTHIDGGTRVRRRAGLAGGLLATSLVLAACGLATSMGDAIAYAPPAPAVAGPLVVQVPGDRGQALRSIAADLRRAGFEINDQKPTNGYLRARSGRLDLLDCGVLTQTARGAVARIDGAAPLAAIFDSGVEGGVLRREVRVTTEVIATVGAEDPQTVTLDERQTVTLRKLTAGGDTVLSSQTLETKNGGSMAFSDGTTCTSSGKLADAFR